MSHLFYIFPLDPSGEARAVGRRREAAELEKRLCPEQPARPVTEPGLRSLGVRGPCLVADGADSYFTVRSLPPSSVLLELPGF